jgi:hypothetical protein
VREENNHVKRRTTGRASALSQAAALLGRKGGTIGGPARAAALSPEQLREISEHAGKLGGLARAASLTAARRRAIAKAAAARWNKEQHA